MMRFKIVSVLILLTLTTNCSVIGFGPALFTFGKTTVNASILGAPNTAIKVKEKIDEHNKEKANREVIE
jgi:hypothetical protein